LISIGIFQNGTVAMYWSPISSISWKKWIPYSFWFI